MCNGMGDELGMGKVGLMICQFLGLMLIGVWLRRWCGSGVVLCGWSPFVVLLTMMGTS